MALTRVRQLHQDLEKLAPKNPDRPSDEGIVAIFNATLQKAKTEHPEDTILAAVPQANQNTTLGDLLVRVGTLKQSLEDAEGGIRLSFI